MTDGSSQNKPKKDILLPGGEIDAATARMIERATGHPLEQLGELSANLISLIAGDYVRELRIRRYVRVTERTASILKKRGLSPSDLKALPNAELYNMFESASRADDERLSSMWAELIAKHVAGDTDQEIKGYVSALDQMSSGDAALLELISFSSSLIKLNWTHIPPAASDYEAGYYGDDTRRQLIRESGKRTYNEIIAKKAELGFDRDESFRASISNLSRLGCVRGPYSSASKLQSLISLESVEAITPDNTYVEVAKANSLRPILNEILKAITNFEAGLSAAEADNFITKPEDGMPQLNLELTAFAAGLLGACTDGSESDAL